MDLQDLIFQPIAADNEVAEIRAERAGIVSGIEDAVACAKELGLTILHCCDEGTQIEPEDLIMRVQGTPKQMVMAEDRLIGLLAKPSGIATAAREFADEADGAFRVVCGSIKKVDSSLKKSFRRAIETGGCGIRLVETPMVYLDKNYVAMFGGIQEVLEHVKGVPELKERTAVVQIKGDDGGIAEECWTAAEYGADIIFLDTGKMEDFDALEDAKQYMPRSPAVAFAGNVTLSDLAKLKNYPVDIVGVGKAVIDAPMIDMRFDVVTRKDHACDCKKEREGA